jgi:hypothetical protein
MIGAQLNRCPAHTQRYPVANRNLENSKPDACGYSMTIGRLPTYLAD